MSLSAKTYFEVLKYADCNECEFYHPEDGYCEKVQYQRKPCSSICRHFSLHPFWAEIHDITEAERKEFNAIYRKENSHE